MMSSKAEFPDGFILASPRPEPMLKLVYKSTKGNPSKESSK